MTYVCYWEIAPMVFTFGTEEDAAEARARWERNAEAREAHRLARPDVGDAGRVERVDRERTGVTDVLRWFAAVVLVGACAVMVFYLFAWAIFGRDE